MLRAVDIIRKKRDGGTLANEEIDAFIQGATSGVWEKYQVTALLMAIYFRGMSDEETAYLTGAMVRSGAKLDWSDQPGPKVDKHSTGGVGDKTSLILAPLAAACGCKVPMMSGRGLGHTGGTLDKLETIPGFRVGLRLPEFRDVLRRHGLALIGQTAEIAPADKLLYALRDVTATVESIPLIAGSIMSKKIAEGIDALVMDVKCGRGAFMKQLPDARRLAETIVAIGAQNGVRTKALITAMDQPLGTAVGNRLEVIESLEILKGRGPADLTALSVRLAAEMVWLGGLADSLKTAEGQVNQALSSGRGLELFRAVIEAQGGDPKMVDDYDRMVPAPQRMMLQAERDGFITGLDAEQIGLGCMFLGAGRAKAEDQVDHAVGVILHAKMGARIEVGAPLMEVHYRRTEGLDHALHRLRSAITWGDEPPTLPPLILEEVQPR